MDALAIGVVGYYDLQPIIRGEPAHVEILLHREPRGQQADATQATGLHLLRGGIDDVEERQGYGRYEPMDPALLPPQYQAKAKNDKARTIADYIAGMTDRYAYREYRRLFSIEEM